MAFYRKILNFRSIRRFDARYRYRNSVRPSFLNFCLFIVYFFSLMYNWYVISMMSLNTWQSLTVEFDFPFGS